MGFRQDLLFALRTLVKSRMVALVAIVSLALIVAGNTVLFSVVNSLLVRPLAFDPEGRLMLVWRTRIARTFDRQGMSPADFNEYRKRNHVFEDLAAYQGVRRNLTGVGDPEALDAARVSPSFFRTVEISLAHGRAFTAEEGRPGAAPTVILSHDFFERRFGGDPSIVGRTIQLDREPYEVVGVVAEGFEFIDWELDVWLPLAIDPASDDRKSEDIWPALGKLRPGVTPEQARADLAAIAADLEREHPEVDRGIGVEAAGFRHFIPGPQDAQLFVMMQGAGIFLLLIGCANLANLLLARGQQRQRELALRSALGASRPRIVRQLLTESVLLALAGGGLGLGLGVVGVDVVRKALGSDIPTLYQPVLDHRVLLFSIAMSVFAGLFFGTVPALRSTGAHLLDNLKEGARSGGAGSRGWLRKGLVVAQVTLALVVLCAIGLLLKGFMGALYADSVFDDRNLLTFELTLPEEQYAEPAKRVAFLDRLHQELRALPGAEDAAVLGAFPRSQNVTMREVENPEDPVSEGAEKPAVTWLLVSPGFFDMMSIPLLRGRDFTHADNAESTPVAIVDRRLAERFWPGEDPVGKRLKVGDDERLIIGMAKPVTMQRLAKFAGAANATVYVPWSQESERRTARFMVRSRNDDPMALAEPARKAVWSLDPDLPVAQVKTYDDVLAASYVGIRVFGRLIGAFAVVALLLAALGVYGVLAYSVARRTREIGVRLALGASRLQVLGMVLRQGVAMAAVGVGFGLPLVWWVRNMLESVVQGLAGGWLLFVPATVAVLMAVVLLASFAPARRAAALSPVQALRTE